LNDEGDGFHGGFAKAKPSVFSARLCSVGSDFRSLHFHRHLQFSGIPGEPLLHVQGADDGGPRLGSGPRRT
jgi:hypothetical protein